jgi:hypothetical protein
MAAGVPSIIFFANPATGSPVRRFPDDGAGRGGKHPGQPQEKHGQIITIQGLPQRLQPQQREFPQCEQPGRIELTQCVQPRFQLAQQQSRRLHQGPQLQPAWIKRQLDDRRRKRRISAARLFFASNPGRLPLGTAGLQRLRFNPPRDAPFP